MEEKRENTEERDSREKKDESERRWREKDDADTDDDCDNGSFKKSALETRPPRRAGFPALRFECPKMIA